jgi:ribosomal protein S18 acetylase RimI-like enzyme
MLIRSLSPSDAAEFRRVRIAVARAHPDAFGRTPEEDEARTVDEYASMIASNVRDGESVLLGAFDEALHLVGTAGCRREARTKLRHRAELWGVAVAVEAQGRGVARALVAEAIAWARTTGIEQITLEVVASNESARRLYASLGFETFGLHRDAERYAGNSYDSEHMILGLGGR